MLKWNDLGKCFSHGIAFTMLFFISIAAWSLLQAVFVGLGLIVGLTIGSLVLFVIIGFLNTVITTYLWFEVRNGLWVLLTHGIVLFPALFFLDSIIITVPALTLPGLATTIVTLVIGTFVNGLVARRFAELWKQEDRARISDTNEAEA